MRVVVRSPLLVCATLQRRICFGLSWERVEAGQTEASGARSLMSAARILKKEWGGRVSPWRTHSLLHPHFSPSSLRRLCWCDTRVVIQSRGFKRRLMTKHLVLWTHTHAQIYTNALQKRSELIFAVSQWTLESQNNYLIMPDKANLTNRKERP